ncbi:cytokine receptor-like factor 2 isoform X2 [Microtus ochrogaster]|uniref:Cytokine receptor-like factor 2 isoform X2 n=1 Tax=Microtus ochrogaster TaxID=79684 RepID=A0ABM0LRQ5_MICOH|nr:cytokine receptor-like factor 2 isoform X2 [Microtus ochrogaster]
MPGPAASIAVILLLQLRIRESAEDVTVVCHDLRDVEVTWDPAKHAGANLSLAWRYIPEPLRPCPRYFLSDGLTSGCILPVRSRSPLEIDVRRGAEPVFHRKGLASAFLKPRPPDKLTLHWLEDAIRVTCPALPHVGLDYVIQHRGMGDIDWVASAPAPSCDVTVGGVDRSACLAFRVRAFPRESFYGGEVQPSDWSPVTQWRAGEAMGAGNGSSAASYPGSPTPGVASKDCLSDMVGTSRPGLRRTCLRPRRPKPLTPLTLLRWPWSWSIMGRARHPTQAWGLPGSHARPRGTGTW